MNLRLIKRLLFPFLLMIPILIWGQGTSNIRFSTLGIDDGLSNNGVNSIVMDDLGFLWVGTSDGLCRYYSSKDSKVFKTKNAGEGGLQADNIRSLLVDSKNNLWIGTRLGGLTWYNQKANLWKTYRHDPKDPTSISNDEVLSIIEDSKGRIWVGTERGLNVLDTATHQFHQFLPNENDKHSLKSPAVLTIMEDDKGWIWAGTWAGGLHLLIPPKTGNIGDATFRFFVPINKQEATNIWKIYQDNEQRYWVGTRGGGLYIMSLPDNANLEDKNWQPHFRGYTRDKDNSNSISNDYIEDIIQDKSGDLWVSTTKGLNIISSETLSALTDQKVNSDASNIVFQKYFTNSDDNNSIVSNDMTCMLEDKQGLIWLGSYHGLSKYNPYSNQFKNHFLEEIPDSPSNQTVLVTKEEKGWIVNRGKGVLEYDFEQMKLSPVDSINKKIPDRTYSIIYSADRINIFFASCHGIVKYNLETQSTEVLDIPQEMRKYIKKVDVRFVYHDSKDRIWLGGETGLFLFDSDRTCRYFEKKADPNSLSDNAITQLIEDSKGDIWVSSYNGLNRLIDEGNGKYKFEQFRHDSNDPDNSVTSNRLISLLELNEILYIGTMDGLCGYDLNKKQFINFSEEGKKDFFLSLITLGGDEIWGTTSEGIIVFNTKTKTFNRFQKKDGIGSSIFKLGGSTNSERKCIYFENEAGVTCFNPQNLIKNSTPPEVYVTEGKVMSTSEKSTRNIDGISNGEITLSHTDYYLSLNFIGNNYCRAEKNRYAYKLDGLEDKWNYTTSELKAVYTNLDYGEYTFRVKASNNDGVWNEEGVSLKIIKEPAYWETLWFQLFVFGTMFFLIFSGINFYTKHIKARNTILKKFNEDLSNEITERKKVEKALQEREQYMEVLVKERTAELESKKEEVEMLYQNIQERNEVLEKIVEKRTLRLTESNQELSRSNQDLEQFAYVASHDLQEPLRNIGNFAGLLENKYEKELDNGGKEYISIIVDGVQRMTKLISSILTYSRVGKDNVEFTEVDLNEVLDNKIQDLSQKISERNAVVHRENLPVVFGESEQLSMIFYNLINNAIKFNQKEKPTVEIRLFEECDNYWTFSVKDNGIGIAKEYQDKIFEIFKRLHGKEEYKGTGIGLAVCKKIVLRHRGKIWIESEQGKGTTFFFTISKKLLKISQEKGKEEEAKMDFKTMMN